MARVYTGFLIDKCLKHKRLLDRFKVCNEKKVMLGLVKIIEIEVPEEDMEETIRFFQENMVDHIGWFKQEFFVHFYCEGKGTVVFKQRTFTITNDKGTWQEAIAYGESIGIKKEQLNFKEDL